MPPRPDLPRGVAHVVRGLAESVRPLAAARAFYAAGSLATGDFQLGVSDFDLVALVEAPLGPDRRDALRALHESLMEHEPLAAKLHCVYVPVSETADVGCAHVTWAHGELYRRPLSGVARAELLRYGRTIYGPPPGVLIPPIRRDDLDAAVRAELSGYWRDAVAKPHLWLEDVYVDLGLLTLARADATLATGRLITKREALARLARFGVSPALAAEIQQRRQGQAASLSAEARRRRADEVRVLMAAGIATLLDE